MNIIESLPQIRGKYRPNAELSKMCWMGVGGHAEVLFQPLDLEDLAYFLKNKPSSMPCFVFGVGSNVLIKDNGIKGVVIRLGRGFNYLQLKDNNIIAGAGCLDYNLAIFAQENSITGLEFFSGIPGTVGGAIAMNAGAYGIETKDVLVEVKAINFKGEIRVFKPQELGFIYRGNLINGQWIFVEAEFKGNLGERDLIKQKIFDIQSKRSATQPIKSKTCGSTFMNPPNYNAWKLIEEAKCRGLKIGGAQVSEMHCNFFINTGNATAKDMQNLITEVKRRVFENSGILLKEEIKVVGEE